MTIQVIVEYHEGDTSINEDDRRVVAQFSEKNGVVLTDETRYPEGETMWEYDSPVYLTHEGMKKLVEEYQKWEKSLKPVILPPYSSGASS